MKNYTKVIVFFVRSFLLFFAFSWKFALSAMATSFATVDLKSFVSRVPIIARGRIESSRVENVTLPDGSTGTFTYFDWTVTDTIKGPLIIGEKSAFRQLGGSQDGVEMQVEGAAEFYPGEEVVLFLDGPNSDGSYSLRSLMLGKLSVIKDADKEWVEGFLLAQDPTFQKDTQGLKRMLYGAFQKFVLNGQNLKPSGKALMIRKSSATHSPDLSVQLLDREKEIDSDLTSESPSWFWKKIGLGFLVLVAVFWLVRRSFI